MPDYQHDLLFGALLTPSSAAPQQLVEVTRTAEAAGLDLAAFQDHPYQPGFLDTWTLLSYLAARTDRIHLAPSVANLPLRPPAVLARAAASLDLLSGGRFELALGAGAFWDAIAAMGGRRLSGGQALTAVSEALDIIRGLWDADNRERLAVDGTHYQVKGARRGPAPAHDIPIWLGVLGPRALRLAGAKADGWMPSDYYMSGPADLTRGNAIIDEAAEEAGRSPREIRRLLNITGSFGQGRGERTLSGPPGRWAEQLAAMTFEYGTSAYVLAADDPKALLEWGDVAAATRELVARERSAASGTR
ncbi:LLM class flavin-dependent oxidoreductase [Actinomadura sp. NTSP31]|uniref:LLM class flavin-dependent oxidoreductase n=1 Tax=Actinomadura sp. NTSP31 TaxID=1735447 RepID=UPI0035C1F0E1